MQSPPPKPNAAAKKPARVQPLPRPQQVQRLKSAHRAPQPPPSKWLLRRLSGRR